MKYFIGVTDNDWYDFLSARKPEEVNFWQPGGESSFKALLAGGPFLFKLKSPRNAIAGVGFFSTHSFLPVSLAWDAFADRNGCSSLLSLQNMIRQYRKDRELNPQIGCIILTNPIFFKQDEWIETPEDWSKNIVSGKGYSTETSIGQSLWDKVDLLLSKYLMPETELPTNELMFQNEASGQYSSYLSRIRLGQGAFRILVTDAYNRRCAISGEKTLPVLEAAHIKPYAEQGPHLVANALLLRSDLHRLFDSGYLTISPDLRVEVSKRIREEFQNGKEYYAFHGEPLRNLPLNLYKRPDKDFISWHN